MSSDIAQNNGSVRFRLSVMMFLEFFIWGAWLPLLGSHLGKLEFSGAEIAWIFNAFALASVTAMFFSTQFADRNFAAERFLAFSHLVGGLAILGLAFVPGPSGPTESAAEHALRFWSFFGLMLLHSLFYVPTISITNSIAFANLRDPQHDFGPVRLWGTIGWIAVSWPFIFILVDWTKIPAFGSVSFTEWFGKVIDPASASNEGTRYIFIASGIASLILAGYSLVLPHTPPKPAAPGGETFAWLGVIKLLGVPFLLVLFLVTFMDATVHQGYFMLTGSFLQSSEVGIPPNWVMPVMSIGQIAEIGTMAVLGWFLKRFGWRTTMIIGVLGHTLRFGVFALAPIPGLVIVVQVLHGICYAFFFATVYIFVDEFFPKDVRSSAQGLFNLLILGVGPFVGSFLWSGLQQALTKPNELGVAVVDYRTLFLVPAGLALLGAITLLLFFHPPDRARAAVPPLEGAPQDDWRPGQREKSPPVQGGPRDDRIQSGGGMGDPAREGIEERR